MLLAFSAKIEMYAHLAKSSTPIIAHICFLGEIRVLFNETKAMKMPIDTNYLYKYIQSYYL